MGKKPMDNLDRKKIGDKPPVAVVKAKRKEHFSLATAELEKWSLHTFKRLNKKAK